MCVEMTADRVHVQRIHSLGQGHMEWTALHLFTRREPTQLTFLLRN